MNYPVSGHVQSPSLGRNLPADIVFSFFTLSFGRIRPYDKLIIQYG